MSSYKLFPCFDKDGYPTKRTLKIISEWDDYSNLADFFRFVEESWNVGTGRIRYMNGMIHLITGGWSGNESIISAIEKNLAIYGLFWESSTRGGLHVFRLPSSK